MLQSLEKQTPGNPRLQENAQKFRKLFFLILFTNFVTVLLIHKLTLWLSTRHFCFKATTDFHHTCTTTAYLFIYF